jgi:hypothetical protein
MAVTVKIDIFWDVTPCGSCSKHQVFLCSMHWLLVTANVVISALILVTLMMEAISSSKSQFLQELHSIISQATAFLIIFCLFTMQIIFLHVDPGQHITLHFVFSLLAVIQRMQLLMKKMMMMIQTQEVQALMMIL